MVAAIAVVITATVVIAAAVVIAAVVIITAAPIAVDFGFGFANFIAVVVVAVITTVANFVKGFSFVKRFLVKVVHFIKHLVQLASHCYLVLR